MRTRDVTRLGGTSWQQSRRARLAPAPLGFMRHMARPSAPMHTLSTCKARARPVDRRCLHARSRAGRASAAPVALAQVRRELVGHAVDGAGGLLLCLLVNHGVWCAGRETRVKRESESPASGSRTLLVSRLGALCSSRCFPSGFEYQLDADSEQTAQHDRALRNRPYAKGGRVHSTFANSSRARGPSKRCVPTHTTVQPQSPTLNVATATPP